MARLRKGTSRRISPDQASTQSQNGDPISTIILVCANVLNEVDGVLSAIRIVDVFVTEPQPEIPVDKQAVLMRVLVMCKFMPEDSGEHVLELHLIRPDGSVSQVGSPFKGSCAPSSKYEATPGGINLVAEIGVVPKQMGTHYFAVMVDGKERGRAPVTLVRSSGKSR